MYVSPTTHVTLLQRLADRSDTRAWDEFHDRYGELIRNFSRRHNLQPADCDEVVQEVLLGLSQRMPSFQYDASKGTFRGYLKTLVLRAIFRRFRQSRAEGAQVNIEDAVATAAARPDVENMWEQQWQEYHMRQAMQTIAAEFNAADQAAFQAYAVEGRDATETAASLSMSLDRVYQAKSRILKRLAELIERQVADEG